MCIYVFNPFAKGKYDAALRDYKKGKFLLESRPGQLVPLGRASEGGAAQQKRILDKVWSTVERAMGALRTALLDQLKDPGRSFEDHEKTIEYVLFVLLSIL